VPDNHPKIKLEAPHNNNPNPIPTKEQVVGENFRGILTHSYDRHAETITSAPQNSTDCRKRLEGRKSLNRIDNKSYHKNCAILIENERG